MRMTHDDFWSAYRARRFPFGTYYVAAYRRGAGGSKEIRAASFYIPVGTDYAKARDVFLTTIRDLRKFKRLSPYAAVHLMEIRDDVILMGGRIDYGSDPVHQWTNRINDNFPPTWPTGPDHYLDNRRADERRGWRRADGSKIRGVRPKDPLFSPDDYQPVD